MAELTEAEKILLRQTVERKSNEAGIPQRWVKACLHDVGQAIENILSSTNLQTAISNAVDTAAAPYGVTFSGTEKRWLAAIVMEIKHTRDLLG